MTPLVQLAVIQQRQFGAQISAKANLNRLSRDH